MSAHSDSYGFQSVWTQRPPRIYIDSISSNAAAILAGFPAEIAVEPAAADLLWIRDKEWTWYHALQPLQALNHIPGQGVMTRKANLAKTLARYHAMQPGGRFSHVDFMPPTYRLSDPAERAAFMAQLPVEDSPDNLWILKPSDLSEGRGIQIIWRFDWLRKEMPRHKNLVFEFRGRKEEYVIQRYVKDVLLLDGRKSQTRVYWLIASLDPLLVLMCREGTVRLGLKPFSLDDFGNPLVHITNTYQQRIHGGQDYRREDLVWDFAQLQAHLSRETQAAGDFVGRVLPAKAKEILAYVVRAGSQGLRRRPASGFFFGLYAADFLLDGDLTPWLTEIQRAPGLTHDDPAGARVVPPMLRGAVSIVLEVLARKRRGEPLIPLSNLHGYEWVVGGDAGQGS